MLTEENLQQIIHKRYENNLDYYTSTEDDYLLRRAFMNDAIRVWADETSVKWKELYKNLSAAADGTKTTTASTSEYAAPTDFIAPSSWVTITETNGGLSYYVFEKNDDVMNILRKDSSEKFYYVTGSAGAYKINLSPTPTATGLTISYSYYKEPATLTSTSSIPEMSKPYFIVYYTLARLFEGDFRNDLVEFYEGKAKEVLDEMVILNELAPHLNPERLEDFNNQIYSDGFGF